MEEGFQYFAGKMILKLVLLKKELSGIALSLIRILFCEDSVYFYLNFITRYLRKLYNVNI